jgi:hypothetical protein
VESKLIPRGLLAGAVAGLVAFVFARIFAEPQIQKAIDYEGARDHAQSLLDQAAGLHPEMEHGEVFTRAVQADVGLGVGLVLFGAAMGALAAVVYLVCLGRVGRVRPRPLALLVAAAGFVFLYAVPFAKYPANPPAIGNPDTVKTRTSLYLVMIIASVVFGVLAVVLGRKLAPRLGTWTASLASAGAFVVAIGVVMWLLDPVHETPKPLYDPSGKIVFPGFPADVLATFRVYSIAAQALLWGSIGLIFGPLADRVLTPRRDAIAVA